MRGKEVKGSVKRSSARSRKEVSENKGRESVRVLRYAQFCFYPYILCFRVLLACYGHEAEA